MVYSCVGLSVNQGLVPRVCLDYSARVVDCRPCKLHPTLTASAQLLRTECARAMYEELFWFVYGGGLQEQWATKTAPACCPPRGIHERNETINRIFV